MSTEPGQKYGQWESNRCFSTNSGIICKTPAGKGGCEAAPRLKRSNQEKTSAAPVTDDDCEDDEDCKGESDDECFECSDNCEEEEDCEEDATTETAPVTEEIVYTYTITDDDCDCEDECETGTEEACNKGDVTATTESRDKSTAIPGNDDDDCETGTEEACEENTKPAVEVVEKSTPASADGRSTPTSGDGKGTGTISGAIITSAGVDECKDETCKNNVKTSTVLSETDRGNCGEEKGNCEERMETTTLIFKKGTTAGYGNCEANGNDCKSDKQCCSCDCCNRCCVEDIIRELGCYPDYMVNEA